LYLAKVLHTWQNKAMWKLW